MTEKRHFTPETERNIITLNDIMDIQRPIPESYKQLILAQEKYQGVRSATSFSWQWQTALDLEITPRPDESNLEMMQRFFKEHIYQHVLIDVGGGQTSFSYMRHLAQACKASAYINVDRFRHLGEPDPFRPQEEKTIGDFYEAEVTADMLDFVARMKDNSAIFAINGVDSTIIGDPEYDKALAQELVRATCKGGIIFGFESDVGFPLGEIAKQEKSPIRPVHEAIERISGNFPFNKFLFEKVE